MLALLLKQFYKAVGDDMLRTRFNSIQFYWYVGGDIFYLICLGHFTSKHNFRQLEQFSLMDPTLIRGLTSQINDPSTYFDNMNKGQAPLSFLSHGDFSSYLKSRSRETM